MIKRQKLFILFVTLFFAAICCCVYNYKYEETETRFYSAVSINQLEIRTSNGNIAVGSIKDTTSSPHPIPIMFTAVITKYCSGRNRDDAMQAIKDIVITEDSGDSKLQLKAEIPGGPRTYGASFDILVPDSNSTGLDLNTTNGNVAVYSITADIDVNTSNGKISLTNTCGNATLFTSNGNVNIQTHNGSIKTHTTNGSIECNLSEFNATDSAGLETTNGSLQLYLPTDVSASIDAYTTNGSISISGFSSISYQEHSRTRVRCRIGSGTSIIAVKTTNGNITIRSR